MRRTPLLLFGAAVPVALLLAGCGGDTERGADPVDPVSSAGSPGASVSAEPTETADEPTDTYADVADPATEEVPLEAVEGVVDVRVWDGARVQENPSSVVAAAPAEGGGVQTLTLGSSTTLGKESSEAEVRYWSKHNGLLSSPAEILDPVVVDGLELQHARGETSVEVVDGFLYADGDIAYRVVFTTPLTLDETARETAIGQVLATLDFA